MSDTISLVVPLVPVGQMRARHARRGNFSMTYKDNQQDSRENELRFFLRKYAPGVPWSGPVELCVKAYMPIPASWSKKKKEEALTGKIRPTVKPDFDNIIKHVKDVMNKIFWDDDKQVVGFLPGSGKYYSTKPRWEITVRKWVPAGGLLEVA